MRAQGCDQAPSVRQGPARCPARVYGSPSLIRHASGRNACRIRHYDNLGKDKVEYLQSMVTPPQMFSGLCESLVGVDGPRSRHRCAITWTSVNATTRGPSQVAVSRQMFAEILSLSPSYERRLRQHQLRWVRRCASDDGRGVSWCGQSSAFQCLGQSTSWFARLLRMRCAIYCYPRRPNGRSWPTTPGIRGMSAKS
jgi:hypothetical protein